MAETFRPENAGPLRDALRWAAAEHTVRSFMISILLVRTAQASGGYHLRSVPLSDSLSHLPRESLRLSRGLDRVAHPQTARVGHEPADAVLTEPVGGPRTRVSFFDRGGPPAPN